MDFPKSMEFLTGMSRLMAKHCGRLRTNALRAIDFLEAGHISRGGAL